MNIHSKICCKMGVLDGIEHLVTNFQTKDLQISSLTVSLEYSASSFTDVPDNKEFL